MFSTFLRCEFVVIYGIGQSTVVDLGGGLHWGLTQLNILKLFQEDNETKMIVLLGQIREITEEEILRFIKKEVDKPEGKSLGHTGAIIEGDFGTAKSKIIL